MLDEIFGIKYFRNDITRIKCNPKNFQRKGYGNIKDLILFYSKSDNLIWNEPYEDYTTNDIERLFSKIDDDGRRYTTVPIHAPGETKNGKSNSPFKNMLPPPGRHWRTDVKELEKLDEKGLIEWSSTGNPRMKIFADEQHGKRIQDIWEFKDPQYPMYPTEKNINLLNQIIKTSSNENSYVLDFFAGSGTTLVAAQNNNRKWIGIDKSQEAIKVTKDRISKMPTDLFNEKTAYSLITLREKG
jgi:adenine-specific DNA-methyltransferase